MAKSRNPHPDQNHPRERRPREDSRKRGRRPQMPTVRRRGYSIDSFNIAYVLNDSSAEVRATPGSGEYIDYVDIHKDDGSGEPGDLVASMWFHDYVGTTTQEIWKAAEWDFIAGEPENGETYWAVCYVSAYFSDEQSDTA